MFPQEAQRGMKELISQEARRRINELTSQEAQQRTKQFAMKERQLSYWPQVWWSFLFCAHVSNSTDSLCCIMFL
jgi:hypothetical protein